MVETMAKETSRWWWIDAPNSPRRSPWLQSTLSELDAKTKAMLQLIEQDADSFAKRAEMYYKKRPELITMIEDFYRAQRSLAERYDQLRSDHGMRFLTMSGSPICSEKPIFPNYQQKSDLCSETCVSEEYPESEVEDPELDNETNCNAFVGDDEGHVDEDPKLKHETNCNDFTGDDDDRVGEERKEDSVSGLSKTCITGHCDEVAKLREENRVQREELKQKDEEKREVIRQLSLAVEMLKDENLRLKKCAVPAPKEDSPKKSWSAVFEFKNLRDGFLGKLANGSSKTEPRFFLF